MIKYSKKILLASLADKSKSITKESDRAIRSFFGTFISDIKRNWVDAKSFTTKHVSRIKWGSVREQKLTSLD